MCHLESLNHSCVSLLIHLKNHLKMRLLRFLFLVRQMPCLFSSHFSSSSLVATSPSFKDAGSGWWMEPQTGHGVPTSSVLASKPACASRKSLLASS